MWKILIVEDDDEMREFLCDVADMLGYQACAAATGAQAVDAARNMSPDLVVQDIMLPDCDGWTVIKNIRALPGLDAVPAVFCSGSQQASEDFRVCTPPASRFLKKPFEIDDLNRAIKHFLSGAGGRNCNCIGSNADGIN